MSTSPALDILVEQILIDAHEDPTVVTWAQQVEQAQQQHRSWTPLAHQMIHMIQDHYDYAPDSGESPWPGAGRWMSCMEALSKPIYAPIQTLYALSASLARLSVFFSVPMPLISMNRRRTHSGYRPRTKEIRFAGNIFAEQRAPFSITHEFAHHLDWSRPEQQALTGRRPHDRIFYHTLLEVVDVMYPTRYDYPWADEYPSLTRMAVGYTQRPS